ncbi:MAG: hypothetical protein GF346_01375 [Candidatus Eisenbacteria bacterium]|nr:hypothetical protein [Candidatus Latescibacterota bacterium]MBD3301081.1 hypothetical protein [Candidatus Eisenbacteria bacterium]
MSLLGAVDRIFAPAGNLSRSVERFEWRSQQVEMARTVAETFDRGEVRIVEAPTGVGKSLAYLIPGALWAREEGKVLLVSTYTRNLQDQILRRDLPLLRRLSDRRIDAAVLKGRRNYLCRRRWDAARGELAGTTDGEVLLRILEGWVQVTESGDFDEGPAIPPRLRRFLPRIASDARFCASRECTPETGCSYKLSRRRAREAQVLLVNHALLVLEITGEGIGLPGWDGSVIDEAHHLPGVAADALSLAVSAKSWEEALQGLGGQGEPGVTDAVRRLIRGFVSQVDRTDLLRRIRAMEDSLGGLLESSRAFFEALRGTEGFPEPGARRRYRLGAGAGGPFPESALPLIEDARALLRAHRGLGETIRGGIHEQGPEADAILGEIDAAIGRTEEEIDALHRLLDAGEAATVYWQELDPEGGPCLRARPLDSGAILGEHLADGRPLVLTSATLAADGSTGFFAAQCGLPENTESLVLPPVFEIRKQVRIFAPSALRDPVEPGHLEDVADGVVRLAEAIPRKLLVLFTAHTALRNVYDRIRRPLEDRGIWVYAQGRTANRSVLVERFEKSERAVLLGAASFWEGVDFPGDHLEILVMARLPFPVPADPFVEAVSERLREEGKDPFADYMLPEAIVRFRQGFGRLIRRRGDRGIFVVLDPRILRRGYGKRFQRVLGGPTEPVGTWDDLIRGAEAWFRDPGGLAGETGGEG